MAKTLQSQKHLKVLSAQFTVPIGNGEERIRQERDYVMKNNSSFLSEPVWLSNMEIQMEILNNPIGNTLKLHVFGASGEYRLIPYPILLKDSNFNYSFNPHTGELDFMVSKIGFSCDTNEVLINYTAKELEEEEKAQFFS